MFYLFFFFFFFFNDTPTTEIYTLSLHDALPISDSRERELHRAKVTECAGPDRAKDLFSLESTMDHFVVGDRKSTRLNSSHTVISYAVFCLKKKKKKKK